MKKILLSLLLLAGCQTKENLSFGDMVNIEEIEKVKMANSSGTFYLDKGQLEQFKKEIVRLTYAPDFSAKVGAIQITLTIQNKEYILRSSTHGEYVETTSDIITKNQSTVKQVDWIYFRTNGLNFDNYTRRNSL